MVVDDRKSTMSSAVLLHPDLRCLAPGLVICGSANINERSQRGDRDSELAAIIRDTDMIER